MGTVLGRLLGVVLLNRLCIGYACMSWAWGVRVASERGRGRGTHCFAISPWRCRAIRSLATVHCMGLRGAACRPAYMTSGFGLETVRAPGGTSGVGGAGSARGSLVLAVTYLTGCADGGRCPLRGMARGAGALLRGGGVGLTANASGGAWAVGAAPALRGIGASGPLRLAAAGAPGLAAWPETAEGWAAGRIGKRSRRREKCREKISRAKCWAKTRCWALCLAGESRPSPGNAPTESDRRSSTWGMN